MFNNTDIQDDVVDTVSDALHDCVVFSVEQTAFTLTIRGRHKDTGEERKVEFYHEICYMTKMLCARGDK